MAYQKKFTETDNFICKEFFSGKSVSVIVRDYAEVHRCSKGEAAEIIFSALKNFAYDYDLDFI